MFVRTSFCVAVALDRPSYIARAMFLFDFRIKKNTCVVLFCPLGLRDASVARETDVTLANPGKGTQFFIH